MAAEGTCAGVDGAGPADCVRLGWSCEWWPPAAWVAQIDSLFADLDEIVCMWCILERAQVAKIPGWNKNKYNRVRAILDGLNCGTRSAGNPAAHVHAFDVDTETVFRTLQPSEINGRSY